MRSLLKVPEPTFRSFKQSKLERGAVSEQIHRWLRDGLAPRAIGVFARSKKQLEALDADLA